MSGSEATDRANRLDTIRATHAQFSSHPSTSTNNGNGGHVNNGIEHLGSSNGSSSGTSRESQDEPIDLRGGRGEGRERDERQQAQYERTLRARSLLAQQQYDAAFTIILQLAENNNALRSEMGQEQTNVQSMIENTPLEPLYRAWLASRSSSSSNTTSQTPSVENSSNNEDGTSQPQQDSSSGANTSASNNQQAR